MQLLRLRKDPPAIPRVIPNREKAGRHELAQVRRKPGDFQLAHDNVVQQKINQRNDGVTFRNFNAMLGQPRIRKYPKPLQCVIHHPADHISQNLRPPQRPMQHRPENEKRRVARPKIHSAANHVLDELDNSAMFCLLLCHSVLLLFIIARPCYDAAMSEINHAVAEKQSSAQRFQGAIGRLALKPLVGFTRLGSHRKPFTWGNLPNGGDSIEDYSVQSEARLPGNGALPACQFGVSYSGRIVWATAIIPGELLEDGRPTLTDFRMSCDGSLFARQLACRSSDSDDSTRKIEGALRAVPLTEEEEAGGLGTLLTGAIAQVREGWLSSGVAPISDARTVQPEAVDEVIREILLAAQEASRQATSL